LQICKDPPPPKPEPIVVLNPNLNDPPQVRTEQDILDEGGCRVRGNVHDNGAVWNPSVLPYGEINCVTCKCKVVYQFLLKYISSSIFKSVL
jgi:hypothetical protein